MISQSTLKEHLFYNEHTGIFYNRKSSKRAGTFVKKTGYVMIGLLYKKYPAHRLAWLYTDGYLPHGFDVDHIDQIRHHNWRKNLRLVSRSCNIKNTKKREDNSTGVTGVSPKGLKFQAYINDQFGKRTHLGTFELYSDAVLARYEAELKFNYSACKENSSALLYLQNNGLL